MNQKQDLNNYIDKYRASNLWDIFETEHYIFHYSKDSVAEKEIVQISKIQEDSYKKIIGELRVDELKEKIEYYFYESEKQKKELMGDDGFAQAIWHDNSIHVVYDENIKPIGEHEDTHLLTLSWGVAVGFFQEGLAEYMSGCVWGRNKKLADEIVYEFIKQNANIDLKNSLSHKFWIENSEQNVELYYPLAGSFTRFLFNKFGLEKYKEFYMKISREKTQEENIQIFGKLFGDLKTISDEFFKTITNPIF